MSKTNPSSALDNAWRGAWQASAERLESKDALPPGVAVLVQTMSKTNEVNTLYPLSLTLSAPSRRGWGPGTPPPAARRCCPGHEQDPKRQYSELSAA